ncbi:MAG: uracil-DNA glycosylase [Bacteroidia bacterium]|nr:uracil-DNA glycosylase [Bacteroidia bacterium]
MHEDFLKIKAAVESCTLCSLSATRTNAVFGMGFPDAEIMLIGEGPGHDEDVKGLPFVGRSGQLLDKILEACGFNRKDHVFIANIVKCRPPENRVPTPLERETCIPYLHKQIEMIDPKIIVLLGATALQGLIDPDAKITRLRGNWLNWNNRLVMPTYHPSALLRTPGLKKDAWEDFKKSGGEIQGTCKS